MIYCKRSCARICKIMTSCDYPVWPTTNNFVGYAKEVLGYAVIKSKISIFSAVYTYCHLNKYNDYFISLLFCPTNGCEPQILIINN